MLAPWYTIYAILHLLFCQAFWLDLSFTPKTVQIQIDMKE